MIPLKKAITSTVGRKFVMAISGLALIGFLVMHLLGNLLIFDSSGELFNAYAKGLHDFGYLLYVAEIGLVVLFLIHIYWALSTKLKTNRARPIGYEATGGRIVRSKGGPSRANLSSNYMIFSGLALLAFLIIHIIQFRFGPGILEGYFTTSKDGETIRDLHRLVVEVFKDPLFVLLYVVSMIFLGFHLRHGFWSLFQSLGAMHPRFSTLFTAIGWLIAITFSIAFLMIPVWIYFDLGAVVSSLIGGMG